LQVVFLNRDRQAVHARQYRRGRSGERPGETRTHVLKIHQRSRAAPALKPRVHRLTIEGEDGKGTTVTRLLQNPPRSGPGILLLWPCTCTCDCLHVIATWSRLGP
jgi:hypothetical protein